MRYGIWLTHDFNVEPLDPEPYAVCNGTYEYAEEWAGRLLSKDDTFTAWIVRAIDELDVIDMFEDEQLPAQ